MNATCERWHGAMTAELYGELAADEKAKLDEHLATCTDCREHQAELQETVGLLVEPPEAELAPTPDLAPRLLARIISVSQMGDGGEAESSVADQSTDASIATVAMTQGAAKRSAGRGQTWEEIQGGSTLAAGDALEVTPGARALLRLADRSELWVNAGTVLRLVREAGGLAVRLIRGEVLALVERQRRAFRVVTSDGTVEVLGTIFDTRVRSGEGTRVSVLRGRVRVSAGERRREVGPRRRIELQRREAMGGARRLSLTEVRRLEGWTEPLRSASRASGEHRLHTVRRETTVSTIRTFLIVAAAAIGLAFLSLRLFGPSEATEIDRAARHVQSLIAGARQIEIAEPVRLSLAPRPGDSWRQTTLCRGEVTERDFFNADRVSGGELRVVTAVQARAGEDPGSIVLDHRVTEASSHDDLSQIHPAWHESMRRAARERDSAIARSSYVQILDSRGQQRDVVANLDFGPDRSSEYVCDPFLLALLNTTTGIPEGPLTEGTTWSCERPLTFNGDLAATITSTLDHFEEIDGERLAVILSETECHTVDPTELYTERVPGGGHTRVIRERLDMRWSQEARHRLSDGRRLIATGQFDFSILALIEKGELGDGQEKTFLAGAQQANRESLELRFEFVTETEPAR